MTDNAQLTQMRLKEIALCLSNDSFQCIYLRSPHVLTSTETLVECVHIGFHAFYLNNQRNRQRQLTANDLI